MSQSSRPDQNAELSFDELIAACQHERSAFYASGVSQSPACAALFRRAFAGDQDAWVAIYTLFDPQVRAWIGRQQLIDADDAVQDTWRNFAHSAPQRPSLVASDDLSPLLGYLRTCVKSAVLMLIRRLRAQRRQPIWPPPAERPEPQLDEPAEQMSPAAYHPLISFDTAAGIAAGQSVADDVEQRTLHTDVLSRASALMETEQERLILRCRLKLWLAPHDILALYPDDFADIHEIRTIVQRITRRLSQDPTIRVLLDR